MIEALLATQADPARIITWLAATQQTPRAVLPLLRDAILDTDELAVIECAVACAWALAQIAGQAEEEAFAHWCNGLALLNRATKPALAHLDAAFAYFSAAGKRPEQGRLLIGRAGLLGQLGRLDEAHAAITDAATYLATSPEHQNRLPALYLSRSDIEGRMGDYAAMQSTARVAETFATQYGQPASQAKALINQAIAALFLGEFTPAELALEQAAAQAQACASAELRARVAVNQARLEIYRGKLFAALRLLEQARADFAAARIDIDQATVAIEEASLYERLHLPHEARRIALVAAATFEQAELVQECVEATLNAARIALALGMTEPARQDLARAAALALRSPPPLVLRELLAGYTAHPHFQRTRAARQAAFQQADAAAAALAAAGILAEQIEVALLAAALMDGPRTAAALRYRQLADLAQRHELVGLQQRALIGLAGKLPPPQAWNALQQAVDLAAEAQRTLPVEELKASYLSGSAPLYAELIAAYTRAGQTEAALNALLTAKGALWAELSAPSATLERAPLFRAPAWLRAKTERDYWQAEAHPSNDPAYQQLCEEHLRRAEETLHALARQHARQRPAHQTPDLATIQCALPPASIAIDYLIVADQIWAYLIAPHGAPRRIELGPLQPIIERLGKLTLQRSALLHSTTPEQQHRAAESQLPASQRLCVELYQHLIAPLERAFDEPPARLVIAADGPLFSVPWAALQTEAHAPYLDDRYDLILVPALALLALPQPAPAQGRPLALGYEGQPPLPQVAAELAAIARAIAETHCINPAHLRDIAWETPPRFLHLAMHGRANSTSPLLSQLALADGSLLLADVLDLDLRGTALVTLSACDSGTTPERGGVALALAGAFLTSGAQAVIASLWPVHDEATHLFMAQLYTDLAAGQSITHALRAARRATRAAGYNHPYYWAAFQALVRG